MSPPPSSTLLPDAAERLLASLRETFADALLAAEHELREAQAALGLNDSNAARERYAHAMSIFAELEESFPLVAALKEGPQS